TIRNLGIQVENLSAADSRIRDVDIALETAALTRNSILQEAALSILAQANAQPTAALALLS
ncbi:MAG: flagellin, partial [Planctomycetota bacterium]